MSIPKKMFDESKYPQSAFSIENLTVYRTGQFRDCPLGGDEAWPIFRTESNEGIRCPHCEESGWVCIDQTDSAAPCPMCKAGKFVEIRTRIWENDDPRKWTWDGGLSYDHVVKCKAQLDNGFVCQRPSLRDQGRCEYHRLSVAQQEGVRSQYRAAMQSMNMEQAN